MSIKKIKPIFFITSPSLKKRRENKVILKENSFLGDVLTLDAFIITLFETGTNKPYKLTWKEFNNYSNNKDLNIKEIINTYKEETLSLINESLSYLISYFLINNKEYTKLKNSKDKSIALSFCFHLISDWNLEERTIKVIESISKYEIILDDYLVPQSILQKIFLEKIEVNHRKEKKTEKQIIKSVKCISKLEEANQVVSYISKFLSQTKSVSLNDIVINGPSKGYFEEALIPVLESRKIKYLMEDKNLKLSGTKMFSLMFSLYKLVISDFKTQEIVDVLFNMNSFSCKDFTKGDIKKLIFYILKYGFNGDTINSVCCSDEKHPNFEVDKKKIAFSKNIYVLRNFKTPLELVKGITLFIKNTLSKDEVDKFITSSLKEFIAQLKLSLKLTTDLVIGFQIFNKIAKETSCGGNTFEHEEGITLAVFDGIPKDSKLNIFMGTDFYSFQPSSPRHLINKNKFTGNFYSFAEEFSFSVITRFKDCLFSPNTLLTYSFNQEGRTSEHSYIFNDLFIKSKEEQATNETFLDLKMKKIEEQKKKIKTTLMRELYTGSDKLEKAKIAKKSPSSINRLFQCNYSYHYLDGIGLKKYNKVCLDNLKLGSWAHEILEHFFDKNRFVLLVDKNKKEIEKEFQKVAKNSKTYIELLNYKVAPTNVLNYHIYYFQKRLITFMIELASVYKKSNISVWEREMKIKRSDSVWLWKDTKPTALTGTIDQVLKVEEKDPFYLIVDFKASNKPVGLVSFPLLKDVQIPLYIHALKTGWHFDTRGGYYLSYFLNTVESKEEDTEHEHLYRIKNFLDQFSSFAILNQNVPEEAKNANKIITLEELEVMLGWMIEEIKTKTFEVEEDGVISNHPLDKTKCKYCRFQTFCNINWREKESNIDYVGKKSEKFLKGEIQEWARSKTNKKRRNYINNFKEGM